MKTFSRIASAMVLFGLVQQAAWAAPETYNIDSGHTFARFSYKHLGLSTQLSRFSKTSGTVVWDKAARTGAVDVVIDMKTVDTGLAVFNTHIQGESYLDTERHPTAQFKSTHVVFDGDKPSAIEGVLTIKGVAKPVTLKLASFTSIEHPFLKRQAIGADASAVIKRSDFNAGTGVPNVADEVTISIALEAILQ